MASCAVMSAPASPTSCGHSGLPPSLARALQRFSPGLPLTVAFSGGADSTALLLACAGKWPGQVRALHVHHGLQTAADAFEQHCMAFCAGIRVPLTVRRVIARAARGQSPEQAARAARYSAFHQHFMAFGQEGRAQAATGNIALAQHADDQVETVLLALSRGAGLPGLAAMPARWRAGAVTFHRPLLTVPQADLRDWLRERGVGWIEDPSNADERFTRNRIRAQLMPALQAAFPQFRVTIARSAAHAAQGAELLVELAAEDLARTGVPPVLDQLRRLSAARQGNLLRHWLLTTHGTTPSAAQLRELLAQIAAATTRGHRIRIRVGAGFVERCGDALDWYNPALCSGPAG